MVSYCVDVRLDQRDITPVVTWDCTPTAAMKAARRVENLMVDWRMLVFVRCWKVE